MTCFCPLTSLNDILRLTRLTNPVVVIPADVAVRLPVTKPTHLRVPLALSHPDIASACTSTTFPPHNPTREFYKGANCSREGRKGGTAAEAEPGRERVSFHSSNKCRRRLRPPPKQHNSNPPPTTAPPRACCDGWDPLRSSRSPCPLHPEQEGQRCCPTTTRSLLPRQ